MEGEWTDVLEQVTVWFREIYFSLNAELLEVLALKPPGLLLLTTAGFGLLIPVALWLSLRWTDTRTLRSDAVVHEPTKAAKPRAEEPKKRSRKRAGDKKLQRNGVLDLQEEPAPVEAQNPNPSESPDPDVGRSDKGKKNKKKTKAQTKEAKSTTSENKEHEEVGSWETKVSHREKRQRRKDKGAEDDSPGGGVELTADANITDTEQAAEEPDMTPTPVPITITKSKKTNRSSKSNSTPTPPKKEEAPPPEVITAVKPPVSRVWEDMMVVNGSRWRDLDAQVPTLHPHTWNSITLPSEQREPEPTAWPHDMDGSWTIVDGSHIPTSFHGLSAGVEMQVLPDLSWTCQPPVDDEWSGMNSNSADPTSDWSAPCEEWGNYEQPAGGAVATEEPLESDPDKDKDEPAAPGSSKAKKKKKKKKKQDEPGTGAQVEESVKKDPHIFHKISLEQAVVTPSAPIQVTLKSAEPEAPPKSTAPPTQKKPEESWESPKQVKKKKARRET